MYKSSSDRRFLKNKRALRRAYLDLTVEKGYHNFSISDLTERADVNRMTFYAHYDRLEDIFVEFIDEMTAVISSVLPTDEFDLVTFFKVLNDLLTEEIDFFRYVSKDGNCSDLRESMRFAVQELIREHLPERDALSRVDELIWSNIYATGIAYAYLDWLAGNYGKLSLDEMTESVQRVIESQLMD